MKNLLCIILISAATSFGQSKIIPIVSLDTAGIIGGYGNGKWLDYDEIKPFAKKYEAYLMLSLPNDTLSSVYVKKIDWEPRCSGFDQVVFDGKVPESGIAFGVDVDWNPVPQKVYFIKSESKVYLKVVSDILKSKGLKKSKAKIKQIVRTDLDGDGRFEIIINAENLKKGLSGRAEVGDYSFVAVRKFVGSKLESLVLTGDFIVKSPFYKDESTEFVYANSRKISDVADLNGDGTTEIVVSGHYYHGQWINVFELKNNVFAEVKKLSVGCE